jgi:hypothetical protein
MKVLYTDKTYTNVNKNNKHVETQVTVSWDYDYDSELGTFEVFKNDKKNLNKFETGELINILIKVTCSADGETGTSYLGSNYVKSNDLENEVRNIVAEYDLKNDACIELKANILHTAKIMAKYIETEGKL